MAGAPYFKRQGNCGAASAFLARNNFACIWAHWCQMSTLQLPVSDNFRLISSTTHSQKMACPMMSMQDQWQVEVTELKAPTTVTWQGSQTPSRLAEPVRFSLSLFSSLNLLRLLYFNKATGPFLGLQPKLQECDCDSKWSHLCSIVLIWFSCVAVPEISMDVEWLLATWQ